jgi:predicted anti-sigma-YlaC factor YlaD
MKLTGSKGTARHSRLRVAAAAALGLLLSSCSVQRFAVNKAGDALSGDSSSVARDDDPEFIRAAAPFSLKLIESLLARSPRHQGMLLAAASGFTQYSYAYIQLDADQIEDRDFDRSVQLRQRAKRMYLRARDYGLRGLEVRHGGITDALRRDAVVALQSVDSADAGFLYWTTAAWAAAISQGKDDPQLVGDLAIVDALAARAEELVPDFGHGSLQGLLITYEMARAGRPEVARAHFARALAASSGHAAGPYVALAESVCVPQRARVEFAALLDTALAIDADRFPDQRLENLIMQSRARWLKSRIDELFLPEAPPQAEGNSP